MAVNHYFQGGDGIGNQAEKNLHENLIIEGLKIYGHDVYYLPRTLVNQDLILETYDQQTQQPYADNSTFESDAGFGTSSTTDDILDFTERNPFGEVDEGF